MGKYHFIAIGGIGMSGLAKYLLEDRHTVSGSDIQDSKYIDALRTLGANVYIGHDEKNLAEDVTAVVVSTAIRESNPELVKAKRLGLNIYHRSDLLKEIAESAQKIGKCFIGFAGTHGKTTTSGMASYVLDKAGLEPSFVDGGIIPELNTNAQHMSGNHFIAELDESDGTIVKYHPDILVINNLEEDHLDFYKNGIADLVKTFNQAISQSKKVIVNADNAGVKFLSGDFITFGLNNADYMAKNVVKSAQGTSFDVYKGSKIVTNIQIELTGTHNIYNTLAVVTALLEAGVDIEKIKQHFATFSGMGRRFQHVCDIDGIPVYDDYAHHPTEIKAVLDAASSKFGKEHIVAVFQPHRYTRLQSLWEEFKGAFSNAGRVVVTDIYSASEDPIEGITSERFSAELGHCEYISGNMQEVAQKLRPTLKQGDIVLGLGAGTITTLGKYLKEQNLANRV